MELVDTHCHLQFENYPDPKKIVDDAAKANVTRLICVGTEFADSQKAIEISTRFENVWAAVGTHPHEAEDYVHIRDSAKDLKQLLSQPKVVAIGEVGLDYYKDRSSREDQKSALRSQIEAGLASDLPFVFHVRDAWSDFWQIFDEYKIRSGVIHSFSAGPKQLEQVLSRGLYVGLNGIITFSQDASQLEAAKKVPLDRLFLETDAPFLTPAPNRNELCEPKHVRVTAEFLANLRGEKLEDLASATTHNAIELFNLKND